MTIEFENITANINQEYPDSQYIWQTWSDRELALKSLGTHFGYVFTGHPQLVQANGAIYPLAPGMYFALPKPGMLMGNNSSGFIITHLNFHRTFSLGGPVEKSGEFAYIDGGRTDVLLSPIHQGDPGLYALHFPPGVHQTMHNHPSDRIGLVINGSGQCLTLHNEYNFSPGTLIRIPQGLNHKFITHNQGLSMIMFHPDSDGGFTDNNHPMLIQTYVDGVSAVHLPQIHTQSDHANLTLK